MLKDAVKGLFEETDNSDSKDFLYSKYVHNKQVYASNTQKRKLHNIIEREVIETSKRSEKDRRLSNTLTNNNIFNLLNEGNCSQAEEVKQKARVDTR
ncbi:unnamed protein product [Mucor hiemalis]